MTKTIMSSLWMITVQALVSCVSPLCGADEKVQGANERFPESGVPVEDYAPVCPVPLPGHQSGDVPDDGFA